MYDDKYAVDESLVNSGIKKVILWMVFGLLISLATMLSVVFVPVMTNFVAQTHRFIWVPAIVVVLVLSAGINKISLVTARTMFLVYSVLVGLMISSIFFIYDYNAIILAFSSTLIIFIVMALFGFFTNEDLAKFRVLLSIGLVSLIVMSLVNIFIGAPILYWMISYLGVILFTALIGYDMQKVKRTLMEASHGDQELIGKVTIIGALQLYLDFVNLFISLLRIFGKKN